VRGPARPGARGDRVRRIALVPQFERNIALLPLTSQNDKWKQGLSPAQQEILTDGVRQSLAHWGYHA
jgi:hypothetical protein